MGKRGGAFILALVAFVHFTAIFFNSTQAFHPLNGLLIQCLVSIFFFSDWLDLWIGD